MRKTWIFVVTSIALLLAAVPNYGEMGKKEPSVRYIDQGWSPELRQQFYHTPQGTELIPYDVFLNLERPDGALFKDDITARYGFILDPMHPDGLPVGFTKNPDGYLGLNCAACHTSQIRYQGKTIYIDGGASMQNNLEFMLAMLGSVRTTVENTPKLNSLIEKTLGKDAPIEKQNTLRKQIIEVLDRPKEQMRAAKEKCDNPMYLDPKFSPYSNWGFGRLDAMGRGGNTVLTELDPCALKRADAPVSIPSIWDTWKYDWVQWNGSIQNPLARNIGQAVGLNARPTDVDIKALDQLENYVQKLKPPRWREVFGVFGEEGQIDEEKAQKGKELYLYYGSDRKGLCARCHVPQVQHNACDGKEELAMKLISIEDIKTDERTAANFVDRKIKTGQSAATIMKETTDTIMGREFAELKLSMNEQGRMQRCRKNEWRARAEYKAPAHAGVWATPPYLHNGSVPNLFQLLLPAEKRIRKFCVGSLEFDPVVVGFRTDLCALEEIPFDTAIPGNSNAGHEFRNDDRAGHTFIPEECEDLMKHAKDGILGCEIAPEDRRAIIEYLKTL